MIDLDPMMRALVAGVLVLGAVVTLYLYARRRRRVAVALADPPLLRQLLGEDLARPPWGKLAAVGLATVALAIALLDPSLAAPRSTPRGPVVLLLDASGSMLVEDAGGPRLERQRELARNLVAELPEVPFGLVAFSGRAFSLTPPTRDRGALEMYLAALDPSIVTQTGSGMGAAIRQGLGLLSATSALAGSLVLLGDGDETEDADAAVSAAGVARRAGVRLHTVGIGSERGGPVPALDLTAGAVTGYLTDPEGNPLVSRLDRDFLQDLAGRAGGTYIEGTAPDAGSRLRDAVRAAPAPADPPERPIPWYAWFAGGALLLLSAEPLAGRRRVRG